MNPDWHLELDQQEIAWLHFDRAGSRTNVLTRESLEALDEQLIAVAQRHPRGLVILSDKESGFIAGADVKAFARIRDPAEAERLIRRAHDIFHRLEALSFPTVAMIHGFCLGGGLELALACRYRVASTEQASLRSRERFWDIRVPKIDSIFDNSLVPRPSWSPGVPPQHRKLVAATHRSPI